MKNIFFAITVLLIGFTAIHANPLENIQGVVHYSENTTVYFNNEENATKWLEMQTDFMKRSEVPEAQRRIMEATMRSLMPNWADLVRLYSDYTVMVVRSSMPGHSSLSLYVRGVLVRMWLY